MATQCSNGRDFPGLCPSRDRFGVDAKELGYFGGGKEHFLLHRPLHTHRGKCPFRTIWAESIPAESRDDKGLHRLFESSDFAPTSN